MEFRLPDIYFCTGISRWSLSGRHTSQHWRKHTTNYFCTIMRHLIVGALMPSKCSEEMEPNKNSSLIYPDVFSCHHQCHHWPHLIHIRRAHSHHYINLLPLFLFGTKQAKSVIVASPTPFTTISFFFIAVCETWGNSKQQVIRSCVCHIGGECVNCSLARC